MNNQEEKKLQKPEEVQKSKEIAENKPKNESKKDEKAADADVREIMNPSEPIENDADSPTVPKFDANVLTVNEDKVDDDVETHKYEGIKIYSSRPAATVVDELAEGVATVTFTDEEKLVNEEKLVKEEKPLKEEKLVKEEKPLKEEKLVKQETLVKEEKNVQQENKTMPIKPDSAESKEISNGKEEHQQKPTKSFVAPPVIPYNPPYSPLRSVVSTTAKGVESVVHPFWQADMLQNPLETTKTRMVVLVWEVSHLEKENILSANAFGSATIPANKTSDDSIRRGLHDIFDRNLGFDTMNSLSCLKVDEPTLCQRLEIQLGLAEHVLLDHLRARIDLLIRFGLHTTHPYTDYRRACFWLASLSHLHCDMYPLTPRVYSSPFVMLVANRENVFYPNRQYYQYPRACIGFTDH
jgi:hypothetical protein